MFSKRKSFATPNLVIYIGKNTKKEGPKIGFSVSKRVGNSVVRAKIKRRLRAISEEYVSSISSDLALVFIARNPIVNADFDTLKRDLAFLLNRGSCFSEEKQ